MPLVPPILPVLDLVRSIGGELGMRVFRVTVIRRVWNGGRPGIAGATKTDYPTTLTNRDAFGNLQPVMVRQVSRAEAIASGGQYTNRDLKVGPMTPSFAASLLGPAAGFDDTSLDPAPPAIPIANAVEIIWLVSATSGTHGIPQGGIVCEKIGEDATSLHYFVVLRATGRGLS